MIVTYFDPRPKNRKEDLYNREKELQKLENALAKKMPLILVTGIRRLGKTSLILVALKDRPKIIVDLRGVTPKSREGLYKRIESAVNEFLSSNKPIFNSIKDRLKIVKGLHIMGTGISLSWSEKPVDLAGLFKSLEEFNVVLAFDEVQTLRGPIGVELAELIAHLFDYTELSIILSGSEVGLLYDFVGSENPNSPLYGRYFERIELQRFDKQQSIDFLKKGFEQIGADFEDDILEYAWDMLDGIVGWLVHFGIKYSERASKQLVDEILDEASKLASEEFKNFLSKHVPAESRYLAAMKAIAMRKNTWSAIKRFVEKEERTSIQDAVISRILRNLLNASFIEKKIDGRNIYYEIADPVLKHGIIKLKG